MENIQIIVTFYYFLTIMSSLIFINRRCCLKSAESGSIAAQTVAEVKDGFIMLFEVDINPLYSGCSGRRSGKYETRINDSANVC